MAGTRPWARSTHVTFPLCTGWLVPDYFLIKERRPSGCSSHGVEFVGYTWGAGPPPSTTTMVPFGVYHFHATHTTPISWFPTISPALMPRPTRDRIIPVAKFMFVFEMHITCRVWSVC